jgi:hypothetical protein
MKEQAGSLLQTVSRFKLDGQERMGYAPVRSAEPRPSSRAMSHQASRGWSERPAKLRGATVTALGAPQPRQAGGEWQEF